MEKVTDDNTIIPNAGFGAKSKFIKDNADLVARFEAEYEKALNWVLQNPDKAAALADSKLGMKAQVVQKRFRAWGLSIKTHTMRKPTCSSFGSF